MVLAPRRYGKSSLVWRVAQELVKEDVLVAQVDLMRTPTKDQLAAKLAKTIHEELATRLLNAKERLKVFAGLRLTPTMTVDPNDGAVSFSFDARAAAEDIDATLEELFGMVGRIAADRERRVVLVLDEFQEVADIDQALIKLMRSVFQQQPDVAHIYLGSKRHMMREIFNDENEPFWRSAKQMELDVIAPELFAPYALARFRKTGRSSTRDACATGAGDHRRPSVRDPGAPLLPLGGDAAWRGRGSAAIDGALDATLRSEHSHFSLIWDGASAAQKRVLQALAEEQPGRPLAADYQRGTRCRRRRRSRRRCGRSSAARWSSGSAAASTGSPSRSSRSGSGGTRARSHLRRGGLDRLADARVGAAAADVADLVEVGVGDRCGPRP